MFNLPPDFVQQIIPTLTRLAIIIFSVLGVVYFFGRLLIPTLKDKGKNRIAAVALVILSPAVTLVHDYSDLIIAFDQIILYRYFVDSVLYVFVSTVFYVTIGWRFYSRADALLDKKFAKDNRRKQC